MLHKDGHGFVVICAFPFFFCCLFLFGGCFWVFLVGTKFDFLNPRTAQGDLAVKIRPFFFSLIKLKPL